MIYKVLPKQNNNYKGETHTSQNALLAAPAPRELIDAIRFRHYDFIWDSVELGPLDVCAYFTLPSMLDAAVNCAVISAGSERT